MKHATKMVLVPYTEAKRNVCLENSLLERQDQELQTIPELTKLVTLDKRMKAILENDQSLIMG